MLSWFFGSSDDVFILVVALTIALTFAFVRHRIKNYFTKERIREKDEKYARMRERKKKAEQKALEIYEAARLDYESALDNLEREDTKQNRIAALEKGRTLCATSREIAHGEAAVTAVDEQMITNDINARTCD